jgi:hypothetical protein
MALIERNRLMSIGWIVPLIGIGMILGIGLEKVLNWLY